MPIYDYWGMDGNNTSELRVKSSIASLSNDAPERNRT